ncbi:MAG: hypothetical protein HC795_16135 [Coleofasciculaceae cyanobacterium RL_1_1]|nr:hypothetical protein [Coleofasciculaceae cyanobacterium RL_1_1]
MGHQRLFNCIFVPQGAEFAAVQRGLRDVPASDRPEVVAIPAGLTPADRFFRTYKPAHDRQTCPQSECVDMVRPVLLGLCGSVSPELPIGTAIAYHSSRRQTQPEECYPLRPPSALLNLPELHHTPVSALNVDLAVCTVADKQAIARDFRGFKIAVIDMESVALLRRFPEAAIVRVVSDDLTGNIPDLSRAFDDRGNLQPLALAAAFAREPIAAARLIRGSLLALNQLTIVTRAIVRS